MNSYVILQTFGRVAERSNATDCKSVVSRLRWFESIPFHHFKDRPYVGLFFIKGLPYVNVVNNKKYIVVQFQHMGHTKYCFVLQEIIAR